MKQNLPWLPRRVCHVFCGVEGATWMVEQLRELRGKYGYDVHAVVAAGQGSLIEKLRAEKIPFHISPFVFTVTQPFATVRATFAMARLFRRERFDVVQSHVFWSAFLARPAAWLADVPVRLAMIAGPYHLQAVSSRWVDGSTAWMETALIASCRKTLKLYRSMRIPGGRLALIYYGSDTGKFDPEGTPAAGIRAELGWPPDTPVVALVAYFYAPQPKGTWTPPSVHSRGVKGHDLLIKAAPLVAAEFPNVKFLLVGNDWGAADYRQQLEHLVRNMNLQDRVVFTGYRPDVNRILRDVDVAVQASRSENLGGTVEALLMECPLVVTRVGGMPDTVRDGETGILVNPADPTDLARGILEMLRNPERARALARSGRNLMIREFSLDRTVADLHALYVRLGLANPRRPCVVSWFVSGLRMAMAPFAAFYCAWGLAAIRRAARPRRKAVETRATPERVPRVKRPHPYTLMHSNRPGDIVPAENIAQLRFSGELPRKGILLGLGWHGLEQDEMGSFRWLGTGAELFVASPDGLEQRLVLDIESGPGRLYRPFRLRLLDESGAVVGSARVARGRGDVEFAVRPGPGGAAFRLKAPWGFPLPTDRRILNARVRRISCQRFDEDIDALMSYSLPEDIVPGEGLRSLHSGVFPERGIFLGRGWDGPGADKCGRFRGLRAHAELVIIRPPGSREGVEIDLEPGAMEKGKDCELQLLDDGGKLLDRATVMNRQAILLGLPHATGARTTFRLVAREPASVTIRKRVRTAVRLLSAALSGRQPARIDEAPRFLVRRISWKA